MLETYRSDGELLAITIRLVERDLVEVGRTLTEGKMRGWRGTGTSCEGCGAALIKTESGEKNMKKKKKVTSATIVGAAPMSFGRTVVGQEDGGDVDGEDEEIGETASDRAVVIFRSGEAFHRRCMPRME